MIAKAVRALALAAGGAALFACAPTNEAVAEKTCPYLVRTKEEDQERRLDILVDAGLPPKIASDRLNLLEELTFHAERKLSSYDEVMAVCTAVIGDDKERIRKAIDAEVDVLDVQIKQCKQSANC